MDKLIDYVCEELETIEKKAAKSGNLTAAEVEYADKLAHLKKNLLKGEMMMGEMEEYSGNMGGGMMGGSYVDRTRGGSYARGDNRGRGTNARRDSMGRYSSEMGYSRAADEMAEKLEELMEDAPNEQMRREIEKLMRKVEQM